MSDLNPYRPPLSHDGGDTPVPPTIVQLLRQTRPWVTFLAILGFIGAGLMCLGGFAVMAIGSLGPKGLPWPIGFVYILMAGLYIFPSLFLFRYGVAIRELLDRDGMNALTEAIARQKSFWRLVGIATLVILCLYVLLFFGAIAFGMFAAAARH